MMSNHDVSGVQTWQTLTLCTPESGEVRIAKGDAVKLAGAFTVTNAFEEEDVPFGEALASASKNGQLIPVKVSGISRFLFMGEPPEVGNGAGVVCASDTGKVMKPDEGKGWGCNLKAQIGGYTLTLASVTAGASVTIGGVTFTAHASTTTPSAREFAVSGSDSEDAAALASLISNPVYGVPGVQVFVENALVGVLRTNMTEALEAESSAETISVEPVTGLVWVLF